LGSAEWVKLCVNIERQRRRMELDDKVLVYGLGDRFDVGDFNGNYRLVPTKEYFEKWD